MEFYLENEAEQFVFYKIPKLLFKDKRYSKISSDAKLLYALLLDRMSLSKKNGWVDEEKRVYIYFSVREIMEEFDIGTEKCTKIMSELDDVKGCGLIHRKKQGQGKPAKIYVMKYTSENEENAENPDFRKSKNKTFENQNSKVSESEKQEFRNSKCNYNNKNNTENNDNDFNHINPILSGPDISERKQYEEIIRENIDYDILAQNNTDVDIDGIVEIMLDAVCSKREYIAVNCDEIPKEVVKSRLLKLNSEHIEYVIECLKKNTTKIENIKSYLLTALYNSYTTIDHYYRAEVNHDMYGFDEIKKPQNQSVITKRQCTHRRLGDWIDFGFISGVDMGKIGEYTEAIKENTGFDFLVMREDIDREWLEDLITVMAEVCCYKKDRITIGCDSYGTEIIKDLFLKYTRKNIEYALNYIENTPPKTDNIRLYLLGVLYGSRNA